MIFLILFAAIDVLIAVGVIAYTIGLRHGTTAGDAAAEKRLDRELVAMLDRLGIDHEAVR